MGMAKLLSITMVMCAVPAWATLLREYPMVMAHDCATGYLKAKDVGEEVYNWTATQNVQFPEQLGCGVRAFDLRPAMHRGRLVMHHGMTTVNTLFSDALAEMKQWLSQNPSEFAVLIVHFCTGDGCEGNVTQALQALAIPEVPCSGLANITYDEAKQRGQLSSGGSLVVFRGCNKSNYDKTVTCYPKLPDGGLRKGGRKVTDFVGLVPTCYGDQRYRDEAFGAMWKYLNETSRQQYPAAEVSQLQALWQENVEGISIGTALGSSLIQDEVRSDLNNEVLARLRADWFPYINFLEINNVCHHGPALQAELLKRVRP